MYEHGKLWWNDINRGKLLICSIEFSGDLISTHLLANQEELVKKNDEFGLMKWLCSYIDRIFSMP
jgi:hypothetical protein